MAQNASTRPRRRNLTTRAALRATLPLAAAAVACGTAVAAAAAGSAFSALAARRGAAAGNTLAGANRLRGRDAQLSVSMHVDAGFLPGLANFQGSQASLLTAFTVFAISLPGIWSTVQRTSIAKFVEKSYVMPGTADGGLEMRAIAGGVLAWFKSLNYAMENSPQENKIRFIGNLQGSLSQVFYLTGVAAGGLISTALVLQVLVPDGPFGLGSNLFYAPVLGSPWAGWYYWSQAFRKDIVEIQLEMSEDGMRTTFSVLGDQETVENLQQGVRFQSPEGQLFMLMEEGMEYQPGVLEDFKNIKVWKQSDQDKGMDARAEKVAENA